MSLNTPILRWARKRKLLNRNPPMYCSCSNCEELNQMNEDVWKFTKKFMKYLIITIVSLIAACVLASVVNAQEIHIEDSRAINAIIGEAENQGYQGMLAVACAIRNRGTLKGVYGEHAPRVRGHRYSHKTYLNAQMAWLESTKKDITLGANHWENVRAFGLPYWADGCKTTVVIKDHKFFKC